MDKKTLLYDLQLKSGAKMTSFAGWEMPVNYSSIIDEHNTVRNAVGVFDVSHMGEFFVYGKESLEFLQKIVPQNIAKLVDGKAVYCQLTNERAGMIDDLIIYKLEDKKYLLIVNAARINEDYEWIVSNKKSFDVTIDNKSDDYSLLALQGPKAVDVIKDLGYPQGDLPYSFSIKESEIQGVPLLLSRTGYTGEDGFELLVKNEYVVSVWNMLFETGAKYGIKPIGLGARDTLRLEAAMHLYGNDMDENITPVEACMSWSIPKDKKEDYNGKSRIIEQLEKGCDRKLIGFEMVARAIPRHEYKIYQNGNEVGYVTSGGVSISLNKNIGLGYVRTDSGIKVGSPIQIMVREKLYDAVVVKRPFIEKKNSVKEI